MKGESRHGIENMELNRETVADLTESQAEQGRGGWIRPPITWTCPQPSQSACCPAEPKG
jgi:hypothetical protein